MSSLTWTVRQWFNSGIGPVMAWSDRHWGQKWKQEVLYLSREARTEKHARKHPPLRDAADVDILTFSIRMSLTLSATLPLPWKTASYVWLVYVQSEAWHFSQKLMAGILRWPDPTQKTCRHVLDPGVRCLQYESFDGGKSQDVITIMMIS